MLSLESPCRLLGAFPCHRNLPIWPLLPPKLWRPHWAAHDLALQGRLQCNVALFLTSTTTEFITPPPSTLPMLQLAILQRTCNTSSGTSLW